ncbi:hypothetical protein HU200_057043 [Digitaria exilis]|uniref:Uncharacterized protein n=1 Tax=Digitaria exilis TaxID=1010633 RepID=A0A835ABW8_9POAL|nr:hypothetical protein HU200_057043 [Digitaria exilis]
MHSPAAVVARSQYAAVAQEVPNDFVGHMLDIQRRWRCEAIERVFQCVLRGQLQSADVFEDGGEWWGRGA